MTILIIKINIVKININKNKVIMSNNEKKKPTFLIL